MFAWLALTAAIAAPVTPRFIAEVPEDARIAAEAWRAAIECTGREGHAHDTIEIVRGAVRGDYLGVARHDQDGLHRIELSAEEERLAEVIVHEVAHGWITGGPPALAEGRAELLADCIVARRPGLAPLQWDDGRELNQMPDLRTWSNTTDHGPAVLADQRTDAYLGAARLMRVVSLLVGEANLWEPEGLDWEGLTALLAEHPDGHRIEEVLAGGVKTQKEALDDPDRDGLPTLAEWLLGTDPHRWDSDSDGWWDGSILGVPARSVPLPLSGVPVCAGLTGGPGGGMAQVHLGGNLRGGGVPDARLRAGQAQGAQIPVAEGAAVRAWLPGGASTHAPGGAFARIRGQNLIADEGCVTGAVASVWFDGARVVDIQQIAQLIDESAARASARWGATPGPVAVSLGGPHTTFRDGVLYLSKQDLLRASRTDRLGELVALAVTIPRLWKSGVRDWRDGEALARALWPRDRSPPDPRATAD